MLKETLEEKKAEDKIERVKKKKIKLKVKNPVAEC